MILTHWENPNTGNIEYKLAIEPNNIICAKFTKFDYWLFEDCESSDKISDKLLALETLARRIEEGHGDYEGKCR